MTVLKFSRLISCSSEDLKFPATNLLKSEVGKSWKCKDPGEKQVVVILELNQSCKISSIDIGNENSAFVEIFVGKSANPDIYEVLRVASILMTVQEAKKGENKHAVRFFKYEEFSKPTVDQSWDRIKITCTQPFNNQVQYGLSFVKVHTKDLVGEGNQNNVKLLTKEPGEDKILSQKENSHLGKFSLKQERDISDLPIGSFFARRNEISGTSVPLKGNSLSAAASMRVSYKNSKGIINTSNSKRLSDLITDFKDKKRRSVLNDDSFPNTDNSHPSITGPLVYVDDIENCDLESKKEKKSIQLVEKKTEVDKKNVTPTRNTLTQSPRTSRVSSSQPKNETPYRNKVKRKPFRKLLEGVVFVISGFQNPYRSELRSKAIKMGAIYKADWGSECTHLLCAFPNTPKAATVKGKGWILRKEWIEDCYSQKKRLLCDGYKLEKNDTYNNVNDEEIWEEFPGEEANAANSSEKAEETPSESLNSGYFPNNCSTSKKHSQKEANVVDIYDADTDIDGDYDDIIMDTRNDYETVILPVLPDFFANKKFYLGTDISECVLKILERYIIGYKGDIVTDVNETNYIISEDARYKENIQNFPVALPDWIWECNDQKRLVPIDSYLL